MNKKHIAEFTKEDLESNFSEEDIRRFRQTKLSIGDKFRLIWIGLANLWVIKSIEGIDSSYGAFLEECFDEIVDQTKAKEIKKNIEDTFDAIIKEFDSGSENEDFITTLQRKIKELNPFKSFFDLENE